MHVSCARLIINMRSNKIHSLLVVSVILLTMSVVSSDCPDHCVCNAPDLECYKTLPTFIPENVSSVTAHGVPLKPDMNFTYTDWHNVTHLSLSLGNVNKTKNSKRRLQDYEFTGLMNLQHLKLLCHCQLLVSRYAFFGLSHVNMLDLSDNEVGPLEYSILPALKGGDILPNISELYLSNITSLYDPTSSLSLYLDNLHTAMENKPLKVLDLSGTKVYFSIYERLPSLLPQLRTLNISLAGPAMFSLSNIYEQYIQMPEAAFTNLQVLDASYPFFPHSQSECKKSPYYYWQFCKTGQHTTNFLLSDLTELYLKNIFGSKIPYLGGTSNTSHLCLNYTIFGSNRSLVITWYTNYLQKLDISDNAFAYIEPELLQPLESLRYLDMSNNKLGSALADDIYARKFFYALKNMEVLLFSNNSISSIPADIFRHNINVRILDLSHNILSSINVGIKYLRKLDLSYNRLISVNFGLNYLYELRKLDLSHNALTSVNFGLKGPFPLELLDLSYNKIISVDSAGCEMLKNLHFRFDTSTANMSQNNDKAGLMLNGNNMSCSCLNLCVFKLLQDQNKTLTCSSNGKVQNADFLFVKHLEYSCNHGVVIAAFSADALLTIILTAGMIHVCKKDWKERKREKAMKILIERGIKRGKEMQSKGEYNHIAFLSHSSDDRAFVLDKVFPKLNEGLRGILKVETRCVGVGDLDMVPGRRIEDEIIKVVEKSSIMIFFVTKSFCKQYWCEFEFNAAIHTKKPLILMMYGKVSRRSMPSVLRNRFESYVRAHWTIENGVPVMTPDWDFLSSSIVRLVGEQPDPTVGNVSDSDNDDNNDEENSAAGGDDDIADAASIASGIRDDKMNADNGAQAGSSSHSAIETLCIDTTESGCDSVDCTAKDNDAEKSKGCNKKPKANGKIKVVADVHITGNVDKCDFEASTHETCNGISIHRCESGYWVDKCDSGNGIRVERGDSGNDIGDDTCNTDNHVEVERCESFNVDKCDNENYFGFTRYNNGNGTDTDRYDSSNDIEVGRCESVNDIGVDRGDSGHYAGVDRYSKNICDNVQAVRKPSKGSNGSLYRFGSENHDDTIDHITEAETVNSEIYVDDKIVVIDNAEQDESADLTADKNALLKTQKPHCGIM